MKRDYIKAQDAEIQRLLDEVRKIPTHEALTGNARTNPHRARVAAFFKERGFPASYASSFWIAYSHGVPFDRNYHNPNYRPC